MSVCRVQVRIVEPRGTVNVKLGVQGPGHVVVRLPPSPRSCGTMKSVLFIVTVSDAPAGASITVGLNLRSATVIVRDAGPAACGGAPAGGPPGPGPNGPPGPGGPGRGAAGTGVGSGGGGAGSG